MNLDTYPRRVSAHGQPLDTSPTGYGQLRRSDDAVDDPQALRHRLLLDGYLYLPGYLRRADVLAARRDLVTKLAELNRLAPDSDPMDAVPRAGFDGGRSFLPEVAHDSGPLMSLLYSGRMIELYERIFGESVRHFDFTWFRAIAPGGGTSPHMDSVFMNRGTLDLLTAWTPLGDIDQELGGLAILEGSHNLEDVKNDYGSRDVDTYCSNHDDAEEKANHDGLIWNGRLADSPVDVRQQFGGRWLTTDFRAGDLLTFSIFTVHCGLDNNADRLRLSCDSRYQPASQPADPRWVGADATAHSAHSKRGVIC
jgi:hypothetical protein